MPFSITFAPMPKREFGFICGHFSVGMSANGFVLPGSDDGFLRKSLIPEAEQSEPFLGIKTKDPAALRLLLGVYAGKHVELQFTPRD